MGLAAGGRMRQEIYEDDYGIDAWDQSVSSRCFVTIVNAAQWLAITHQRPPSEPVTAADYAKWKLPWFDYYDADAKALQGAPVLAKVKSVAAVAKEKGDGGFEEKPLPPLPVIGLRPRPKAAPRTVGEGTTL